MPVLSDAPKATSLLTPGARLTISVVNWLLGTFRRMSPDRVTEAVSVDLTSTVGDWAVTVISSDTVAGFSWMSSVRVAVVFTRIFSRTTVPKPLSSALTLYSPGGKAGKRYSPLASVTKVRRPMRFMPERVTLTPGRDVPCSSAMTPRRAPVSLDWEKAIGARRRIMARKDRNFVLK